MVELNYQQGFANCEIVRKFKIYYKLSSFFVDDTRTRYHVAAAGSSYLRIVIVTIS
jgi:hypothetical protein